MIDFLTQLRIQLGILPPCETGDFMCSITNGALSLRDCLPSFAEEAVMGGLGVLSRNPYTSVATTAALGLSSWYYFKQSHTNSEIKKSNSGTDIDIDIREMKDQEDVQRLIHYYAHQSHLLSIGEMEGQPLLKVTSNILFSMVPYVAINRKESHQETTSQALHEWTLKTLAYLLLSGQKKLPNELRCFMALNHLQKHWTALNTSFHIGKQAQEQFTRLRKLFSQSGYNFIEKDPISYTELNDCVNFIKETAPTAENILYVPITFESIQICHADSVNSKYFNDAVLSSAQAFIHHFQCEYYFAPSIQQKGNTCADFTVLNGMTKGSQNQYPVNADSHTLRALTDQLSENAAQNPHILCQY